MKILYLHGLDSFLQDDRKAVLKQFGTIKAPVLDYLNTPCLFEKLIADYQDCNVIIGSSAGGLVAYYLAQKLKKACLIFNPALPFRDKMSFSTYFDTNYSEFMLVVVGKQDEVINSSESLQILQEDILLTQNVEIHIINTMKHSYPIEIFEQECNFFFRKIGKI